MINRSSSGNFNGSIRRLRSSSYDHENERRCLTSSENKSALPRKSFSGSEEKTISLVQLPPIDRSSTKKRCDGNIGMSSVSKRRAENIIRAKTPESHVNRRQCFGIERRISFGHGKMKELDEALEVTLLSEGKRRKWFTIAITIISAIKFQKLLFLDTEILSVMKKKQDQVRYNARVLITVFFRGLFLKSNERHRKRAIILLKHGWRIKLFYRCVRRKMAVAVVRQFFQDYSYFSIPYLMYRYRTDACRLQKYFRSFLAITEARVTALNLIWIQVERDYTREELPQLLEKERELERQRRQSHIKHSAWKDTRIDGVHFPHLIHMANRATVLASSLSESLEKGHEARNNFKSSFPTTHNVDKPAKTNGPQRLALRMKAIRDFLTSARLAFKISADHNLYHFEPSDKLTLEEAKQIIRGESCPVDIARVKQIKRKAKSVLMLYTGDTAVNFINLVQEQVRMNYGIGHRKVHSASGSRIGYIAPQEQPY